MLNVVEVLHEFVADHVQSANNICINLPRKAMISIYGNIRIVLTLD